MRLAFDVDDLCPNIHCMVGSKKEAQKSIGSEKIKSKPVIKEVIQPIANSRRDYRLYNSRPGERTLKSDHFNDYFQN